MQEAFGEQALEDVEGRFAGNAELQREIAGRRQSGAACQAAFDYPCTQLSVDLSRQVVAALYR
ncbi:hypothetical protein BCAR13_1050004 [Paraburkholderia caribensis]|nr:hypothetical protein BCAR13_1050004 [Paraburkholderia caribensis]